jgi:hypothetical protein
MGFVFVSGVASHTFYRMLKKAASINDRLRLRLRSGRSYLA